jgi:4-hydroxy-4-methyl-2-oxoglutarate aldolase
VRFSDPAEVAALTPDNPFGRLEDGRPKVPDELLERMKLVTLEEAWGVMKGHNYHLQYEGDWKNLHPERVMVGRALTATMVPTRPDLDAVTKKQGELEGRKGSQNNWVIQSVREHDVVVVDLFGKVVNGTFVGDNLSSAVMGKGGAGLVLDGGIRDTSRIFELPKINVFCRGFHPTAIGEVNLTALNGPTRIGQATCMPGDIVLGTMAGVIFIPPHLAEEVVRKSEETRIRDQFGKQRLREQKYASGQIDVGVWEPHIQADFEQWLKKRQEEQPAGR